jgi:membrane protein
MDIASPHPYIHHMKNRVVHFVKGLGRSLWRGAYDTIMHDGIEHAGYLAFLGLLSLFPFLVFVVALLGTIQSDTPVAIHLTDIFRSLPPEVIHALEPRIEEITSGPPQSLVTLAIVGAIWTSSSAVEGMRTILNRAYRVHTPPAYIFRRTLSILQMILFAFVLIVGMLLLVTLPALTQKLEEWLPIPLVMNAEAEWWSRALTFGSLGLLLSAVGWIYFLLPNIKQKWISVWPGATLAVALWLLVAQLFTYYLHEFQQVTLIYGSLGGIIVALLFFYVCNIVLILGAEFNYHLSQHFGMKVEEREKTTPE